MKSFSKYLSADFMKTKGLPFRLAHLLIPICVSVVFLAYYAYTPWDSYSKAATYFQVLGIGHPFLIGLFCVMLSEQEATAGGFQGLLGAPKRVAAFFSKLTLLVLFGGFSLVLACVLFGMGYFHLLNQQFIAPSFYWSAAAVLFISSIFLYIWHLFLAFRFNKGVSIGMGIVESLLSALLLTGLGDGIWMYIPSAWASRLVSLLLLSHQSKNFLDMGFDFGLIICIIATMISLVAFGFWSWFWDGTRSNE